MDLGKNISIEFTHNILVIIHFTSRSQLVTGRSKAVVNVCTSSSIITCRGEAHETEHEARAICTQTMMGGRKWCWMGLNSDATQGWWNCDTWRVAQNTATTRTSLQMCETASLPASVRVNEQQLLASQSWELVWFGKCRKIGRFFGSEHLLDERKFLCEVNRVLVDDFGISQEEF